MSSGRINGGSVRVPVILYACLVCFFVDLEIHPCGGCEPKNPEIVGVQKKLKRSVPHFFSVNVVPCAGKDELYYKWEMSGYRGRGDIDFPQLADDKPVYKFDGYRLKYPDDYIFDVVFFVNVKISHSSDFSDPATAKKQFMVIPDKMHLEIDGGSEKTHPVSEHLILDATPSKDISFSPDEDAFLDNKMFWTSEPKLTFGAGTQEKLSWTIPKLYFKAGDVYDFVLTVERTKLLAFPDTKSVKQRVIMVDAEVPELNLHCVRNCLYLNHEESTLFKVTCNKNCDDLNYEWEVNPDAGDVEFGNGQDQLLIKADTFKPGQNIEVVVKSGVAAKAMMQLNFMPELVVGQCSINPNVGISSVTNFNVICENFKSPNNGELRYNVFMKGEGGRKILLRSSPNSNLTNIILSEGTGSLWVLVRDTYYLKGEIELKVEVSPLSTLVGPDENMLHLLRRMVLMKLGDARKLKTQQVEAINVVKIFDAVIQTSSIVFDELERNPPSSEEEEDMKNDILKHVLESVYELNVVSLPSARQVLTTLQKYYEKKETLKLVDTPPYLLQLVSKSLLKVSKALFGTVSDPREIFITTSYINEMATGTLKTWSEVIEEYSVKIEKWAGLQYPEYQYYESYEELDASKFWLELNKRRFLEDLIESVELLQRSVVYVFVPNQKPLTIETDRLTLTVERLFTKDLDGKIFPHEPTSHIKVSEALALDLKSRFDFIDLLFAVIKTEGKLFLPSIITETVILNLIGNKTEKITKTDHDFDINLKIVEKSGLKRSGKVEEKILKGVLKPGVLQVHSIKLKEGNMLKISFDSPSGVINVNLSSCYPKTKEVENHGIKIDSDSSEDERSLKHMPKEEEMIYLAILSNDEIEYSAKVETFSCGHWDSAMNEWNKKFCIPKNISKDFISCSCSHASLFGGEFFVPPNKLNSILDMNFALSLQQNPLVAITVGVILLIWILLMIWAKIKDSRLDDKNYAVVLKDNTPGDLYPYLITFFTGIHFDGGTTADLGFQIIGSQSESRVHIIIKPNENGWLKRGSDDWFIFFTPEKLGDILKIRIWHNCKGRKPHWFCDRVIVQNLDEYPNDIERYFFDVEKWFSLIWGDGKIYRELIPVSKKSKQDFNTTREVVFSIRDKHLWFSVWVRPTQSNFTCKERVSSAISFLMLSMLVSAMFYGVSTSKSASMDSQSSFAVTFRQFLIVAETMAISVPISMIISFLFRNSATKHKNS